MKYTKLLNALEDLLGYIPEHVRNQDTGLIAFGLTGNQENAVKKLPFPNKFHVEYVGHCRDVSERFYTITYSDILDFES